MGLPGNDEESPGIAEIRDHCAHGERAVWQGFSPAILIMTGEVGSLVGKASGKDGRNQSQTR